MILRGGNDFLRELGGYLYTRNNSKHFLDLYANSMLLTAAVEAITGLTGMFARPSQSGKRCELPCQQNEA